MNTQPLPAPSDRYTFHVLTAAAQMPNSCKGVYKRVAVLRVDHHEREVGYVPKTIRGLRGVEIMRTWERLNVGTTDRCAYKVALAEARAYADECRSEAARQFRSKHVEATATVGAGDDPAEVLIAAWVREQLGIARQPVAALRNLGDED